jgi:hypothetical protein
MFSLTVVHEIGVIIPIVRLRIKAHAYLTENTSQRLSLNYPDLDT